VKLRDYQRETVAAAYADWAAGKRRIATVLPTGAGKTVVFAHVLADVAAAGRTGVVIAHRDELIEQAADKLRQVAPGLRIGIFKAERRETVDVDVVVASVQSLTRPAARVQLAAVRPRLVVVDETHHVTAATYRETLRACGAWAEDWADGALVLGVTATLVRGDRMALGDVIEKVSITVPILKLIREEHLLPPRGRRVRIAGLDLGKVKRAAGDYRDGALGEAMHDALAPAAIARAYVEHCADRQGIAFLPTVALAYEMAGAFIEAGVSAAAIDGAMHIDERRKILAASRAGDIQVVCNCMVLTEGTDMPWISAIVLGRPTSNGGLYVQMVGRGLRPYLGQRDCLVLDVVGVTRKHKLATLADLAGAEVIEKLDEDLLAYEDDEIDLGLGEDDGYGADPLPEGADGPLVTEIVDLFTASHAAWKRTRRGVWYLASGDGRRYVFLVPGPERDRYDVAWCGAREAGGGWIQRDMEIGYAMARGQEFAEDGPGGIGTARSARWRSEVASTAQVKRATALGISLGGFDTKGDVSDLIDQVVASDRLDAFGPLQTVTPEGYWS
jgi:superfamily II DNA or RNA helicase